MNLMNKRILVVFALLFISILSGCQAEEATQEFAELYVTAHTAEEQPLSNAERFFGEIVSKETVTISSSIPGNIKLAPDKNGEEVHKGDLLFLIENKDLESEILNKKAAVGVSKANLEKMKAGVSEWEINSVEENVQAAKAKYDAANLNTDRLAVLFENGAISKQQLEQAETELEIAKSQYASLKYQLEQMKAGPTKETVQVGEAQYQQANAAYTALQSKVKDLSIKSPISGFIADIQAEKGEFVGSGMPLAFVHNIDQVYALINIPESYFLNLNQGDQVVVKTATLNKNFNGTIIEIPPHADLKTNLFKVKVIIDNENGLLKPGMTAEVNVPVADKKATITVPADAVLNDRGEYIVYVIENDMAEKRVVHTGIRTETNIEIVSGLQKGEVIIVDGVEFVRDGDKVQTIQKESGN
ncbi:RND family efflux transporter, MFP subunit [Schinkia azotoformans MEV2011]|uniref:RND family efflux transporter, MFP subunit n=2 Tax=Schinkia azotoformans TaxID=1454 RepID=A0A072NLQ9_SCHAZ|nr:RND family efflux transporter, MFP subunit [Schinkia azotoformans MEV2011]